jgi:hypothetical protein
MSFASETEKCFSKTAEKVVLLYFEFLDYTKNFSQIKTFPGEKEINRRDAGRQKF